jgi:hypothetical protein
MSSSFICLTSNSLRASSWMKHPAIELARLMMVWTQDMIRDMPIYFITKTFEEWNCFSMLMMLCFQVSYVNILIFDSVYYVYIYMCVCVYAQLYADSSSSCGKSASNPHFWLLWCVSHAFWLPFLVFVVSRCFKGLGLRYLSISFYYPLVI